VVAVILVNFNGVNDTLECISSLKNSTYKDFEIIVVDNCSTDNSVERLVAAKKNYSFTLLQSNENKGFSAGNNIGIQYALEKGAQYFWLLNNDTVVENDCLEKLLMPFKLSAKCGLTIGKIFYEKNRDTIWYAGGALNQLTSRTEHWHYMDKDNKRINEVCKVTFATGCCMCISKELIQTVGLLDESYFLYEEDAEYCCRVNKSVFEMIFTPDAHIYHKVSASTGTASPMSQYYTIRNKYYLIHQHFKGLNRIVAYFYITLQLLYRCVKGESEFRYFKKGVQSFLNSEMGKVDF
jgi:hypothetical protein